MAEKLSAASNLDSIQLQEQATVGSTPGTGYGKLICLSDGTLHYVNDSGTDVDLSTGSGATTALDNLASVQINTSLVSDTDSTDNLGATSSYWANSYIDTMYLSEQSEPSTPAGTKGVIYIDTADGLLKFKNDAGSVYTLGTANLNAATQSFNPTEIGLIDSASTSYTEPSTSLRISGFTTTGGNVMATFSCFALNTSGSGGTIRLVLHDGSSNVVADADADTSAAEMIVGTTGNDHRISATWSSLAADTYSLRVEVKTTSGNIRINNSVYSMNLAMWEIA